MSRIHAFTVNYRDREDRGADRGLLDRGFFVHNLPRLIPLCRLLGHKPVVDGVGNPDDPHERRGLVSRWVCCDRCGVRPEPQGDLDPRSWHVGDPYREGGERAYAIAAGTTPPKRNPPGPWPTRPTGDLNAEVVIGRTFGGLGIGVEVGCAGDDHTLSAHLRINPLGALYLSADRFGTWVQRRLNPTGHETKEIELSIGDGRLYWKLWADANGGSRKGVPRWRNGSIRISPRDLLLGERRYDYTDIGEPVTATVRMPHGDDHQVTLQLKQQAHGRAKGRKKLSWSVSWNSGGIPTEPGDRGGITGSVIAVSNAAVDAGTWPHEAAAAIAARLTTDRTRYGYQPAKPALSA